ncbi:hypothetical protein ACFV4M_32890 [Kitasatospora indigofera]|uniref:hypothetical protein n=1 Tax=Kitasatospora indigofera TaxID=67307 RepID=UPI00365D1887
MLPPQPAPRDQAIIDLLQERDGLLTEVVLDGGVRLVVLNIAWGYDIGDAYAHVTTNVSPFVEGAEIDFFFTSSVTAIADASTGGRLLQAP